MILLAQFSSALMYSAPFLSSSDAPLPIHRYALLSPVFSRKASLEFRLVALTLTWSVHDVRHMMNKDLLSACDFFCGDRCPFSRRVLTSAILVMGPRFRRTWKSRVGDGGGWFPRRDVPCLYTIRGFDLKRLSRWGGSLPWHTLTWQHTQKTPYYTWKTLCSVLGEVPVLSLSVIHIYTRSSSFTWMPVCIQWWNCVLYLNGISSQWMI